MPGTSLPAAVSNPAAELDRRFYAFALDRLVVWGMYAVAGALVWYLLLDRGRTAAGVGALVAVVLVVSVLLALLVGLRGTTPGKAALGLRVVHEESGRPIGVPAALVRTLVLGAATLPTAGLGLATLAWTAVTDPSRRRRGAHDRVAHAVVVDVRPVPVVVEEVASAPRHVVNLTALRLVPAPAAPPPPPAPPRAPRPVAPPPSVALPASLPVPPAHAGPASAAPPPAHRRTAGDPVLPAAPALPAPASPTGGRATAERTVVRGAGHGPARWRVTFDSGESFVVEGLALVGRRPEGRQGEPVRHLVPLRSDDMSLSKTHAQLQVAADGVLVVMDRGSTNGSVLVRLGASRPLPAGRPTTLVEGDEVQLGDRRMSVARAD